MQKNGYIQIYTGEGKGKTTASLGLALRAIGHNWKVLIIQFMKGENAYDYGELKALSELGVTVKQFGTNKILLPTNITDVDRVEIFKAWKCLTQELQGAYDLIILDEILGAIDLGLLTQKDFFNLVATKNPETELALTGRMSKVPLRNRMFEYADYVSDIACVKHPFNKTCKRCKQSYPYEFRYCPKCSSELLNQEAREGVEF